MIQRRYPDLERLRREIEAQWESLEQPLLRLQELERQTERDAQRMQRIAACAHLPLELWPSQF